MALLLVFFMMAQTIFAQTYRVLYPESKMTCGDKDLAKRGWRKVYEQQECETLCDEQEDCNTIFLSYKNGRNPYYKCYLFTGCNYLITFNLFGTTFTKQPKGPARSVANADYIYDNHGIDGACARPSDDSTEEEYGIFGSATTPHADNMEDCQHLCNLSVTCTGYWWREDNESEDQCVLYEEPIETTHEDRGRCMIREFHPLTPVTDVAKLLKLIPKRLEKLVVLVRRSAKRSAAWCADAADGSRGKESCEEYSSVVDELLHLPEGGRNVKLKKDDVPIYNVGDNAIRDVATLLRMLKAYEHTFQSPRAVNEDGKMNRHVQEILDVAEDWGELCKKDFLEPLERITTTDRGRYSPFHINSAEKHDTRNVVLLRQVLHSLEDTEDFYWMEPLLLAYHTLAEHYNTIIGRPLQDGSF